MTERDQKPIEDTLLDRGVDDILDEGYSPPERMPSTHGFGTTAEEQRAGEDWEQRLVQEEPEPDPYDVLTSTDQDEPWPVGSTAEERAGRLVAPDAGLGEDTEKDEVATDVGVDGGAASAEEAAMHVLDPTREP